MKLTPITNPLALRLDTEIQQLTAQVMAAIGIASSALRLGQQTRDEALAAVESARLAALAEVQAAVTTAVTAQMGTKADKSTIEQLTVQVMATMGLASSALRRNNT